MKRASADLNTVWLVLALAACGLLGGCGRPVPSTAPAGYPYRITFEVGFNRFAAGDAIEITEVFGSVPRIEANGNYWVAGRYTLDSEATAELALHLTTKRSVSLHVDSTQFMRISRGAGVFHLAIHSPEDGYLHVSFYSDRTHKSIGGVYFGTGETTLRAERVPAAVSLNGPNRQLMDYLGNPVPPPTTIQPAYSRQGLLDALERARTAAHATFSSVVIDDSEYPFLIGVICSKEDFERVFESLNHIDGYHSGGSVSGSDCHVFSITPPRALPQESREGIRHRLMLREDYLYDRLASKNISG